MSGYARAVRQHAREKAAARKPHFIMQASPINTLSELADLEIIVEGLEEQQLHRARVVTIDAWNRKMDKLGLPYTKNDVKKYADK